MHMVMLHQKHHLFHFQVVRPINHYMTSGVCFQLKYVPFFVFLNVLHVSFVMILYELLSCSYFCHCQPRTQHLLSLHLSFFLAKTSYANNSLLISLYKQFHYFGNLFVSFISFDISFHLIYSTST